VLSDAGFFDTMPVRTGEHLVSPRHVTAALLFPQWQYEPGERDLTVLLVDVSGRDGEGQSYATRWQLVDRPGPECPLSSMARTTGCPAAICARWLVEGRGPNPGIHPPERLGLDGHAPAFLEALAARGIVVQRESR